MKKIESVWNVFIRRMVKGGFQRKNAPTNNDFVPEEKTNWAYKITNADLKRITNTTDIKVFCKKQHLKYVAHVMRGNNNSLQKQSLFCSTLNNRWRKMASGLDIDEQQLRRTMMVKKGFNLLLE